MHSFLKNWSIQIKKGYLELCVLSLIEKRGAVYGLELIGLLEEENLNVKEGTLYPLLSRMNKEKVLAAKWVTAQEGGHPRKFYSLSSEGKELLQEMKTEFEQLNINLKTLSGERNEKSSEARSLLS